MGGKRWGAVGSCGGFLEEMNESSLSGFMRAKPAAECVYVRIVLLPSCVQLTLLSVSQPIAGKGMFSNGQFWGGHFIIGVH